MQRFGWAINPNCYANFETGKIWSKRRIPCFDIFKFTTQWKWNFSSQNLLKRELRTNLPSVKLVFPQNSVATETPRPGKMTHSFPNLSQENTVRIRTDEQNLWDKKTIVIKQNNWTRSYDALNENRNVMIRSRRHLIPTNEKLKRQRQTKRERQRETKRERQRERQTERDFLQTLVHLIHFLQTITHLILLKSIAFRLTVLKYND